jgi:hypothetical protein
MYTTKDTNTAVHLITNGWAVELEKIGQVVWFNFKKDAGKEADGFIATKKRISESIDKLLSK